MPTNPTDDVIERAEVFLSKMDGCGNYHGAARDGADTVRALMSALRTARADTRRLDYIITGCSGLDFSSDRVASVFFAEIAKHRDGDMRIGFRAAFDAAIVAEGSDRYATEPLCRDCGSKTFDGGRCRYDSVNHSGAAIAAEER